MRFVLSLSAPIFVLLLVAPSTTTQAADEKKLVLIQVENQTSQDIFVHVDDTGRIGEKIKPDILKKPDGTDTPKGLLLKAKSAKSFGEAIGVGDSPTMHAWKVKDDQHVAENKDFSNKKFSPLDYATVPPKLDLKFVDGKFEKK